MEKRRRGGGKERKRGGEWRELKRREREGGGGGLEERKTERLEDRGQTSSQGEPGLCSTGMNWLLCPHLFQPHLASPGGKMQNRYASATHMEKSRAQGVSRRLRLSGMEPTSTFPAFPRGSAFCPSIPFKAADWNEAEEVLCSVPVIPKRQGTQVPFLFLCNQLVQRMEDLASGMGQFQRSHLPFPTESKHSSHLTETPGFPPACKPPAQMS